MGSFSLLYWILFAFSAYAIWAVARGKHKASTPADATDASPPTGSTVAKIRGNGLFESEVVGEIHYAASFHALLQAHKPDDLEDAWTGDAVLKLEDSNPHDANAVAVFLEGRPVGYLSRDTAKDFRRSLVRDGFPQLREVAVGARLYWGGDDEIFSVSLDLPQA